MGLANDIEAKVREAVAANEANDFATAETKLRSAIMLMGAHPRIKDEDSEREYSREDLEGILAGIVRKAAQQQRAAAGGFVNIPIRTER